MARPKKQTVDYFPHYVSEGKTKLILQNEFGNDGYAFWYKLLELLCESEYQVYDYSNPASWRLLLAKTHVTDDNAVKILQLLADLETIDSELHEKKIIWSQKLIDNLELVYKRRATGTPEKPVIVNKNPVNVNKKPQTKLNNTKLNNTIYIVLFNLWNEQGIITHKKLTNGMKQSIDSAIKDYSQEEIEQAMRNYAVIVKGADYYFDHKWTLAEFLSRGKGNNIERFLDLEVAKSNFKKEAGHAAHKRDTPKRGGFAGFKAIESGPEEPDGGDED